MKIIILLVLTLVLVQAHALQLLQQGNAFPAGIRLGSVGPCNSTVDGVIRFYNGAIESCDSQLGVWETVSSVPADTIADTLGQIQEDIETLKDGQRNLLSQIQGGNRSVGGMTPKALQNALYCSGNGIYVPSTASCNCYSDNTFGYYEGVACEFCQSGFLEDADSYCLVDIDECATGAHNCGSYATCTNHPGSFSCACDAGFSGDGITCVDIDECQLDPCEVWEECTNLPGSFTCEDLVEVTAAAPQWWSSTDVGTGTEITLTGRGFQPGTQIDIDGVLVSTTYVSPNEIRVTLTDDFPEVHAVQTMEFSASEIWSPPTGVSGVELRVWGGGGGGGAGHSQYAAGGGGGGFSLTSATIYPEYLYNVQVGAGGDPQTVCSNALQYCGAVGGTSSFGILNTGSPFVTASGGSGAASKTISGTGCDSSGGQGNMESGGAGNRADGGGGGGNAGGLSFGGHTGAPGVPNGNPGNHGGAPGAGGGGGHSCQGGHRGGGRGGDGTIRMLYVDGHSITVVRPDNTSGPIAPLLVRHPTPIEFNTPGTYTWTSPSGSTMISEVYMIGGGGGGGSGDHQWAAGAGGGGFTRITNVQITPNTNYTIVVGAGGAGQTVCSSSGCGADGGASSAFGHSAGGGKSAGDIGNGSCTSAGGIGETANGQSGNRSSGNGAGGNAAGGSSYGSGSGAAAVPNGTPGNHGNAYGGGGGGGHSCQGGHRGGGNGAGGRVVIQF